MPLTDPKLSICECAEHQGTSELTIRRWIAKGLLPAERLGPKLIRVRLSDLEAMGKPIGGDVA
ncbi:DNA-binding protein [Glaciihabitans sp. INWT7]|uniref:helix-turn-helix transcriptional regulator n=1 Tax=Glaciihabitans sp. INWT7 TaxID=2596912 RepID=UPI00162AAC20|nr:DNA-binding protein [Glaciihabitans sp. INWT7]